MEITKKTEYAISALLELALNQGEYISSKEIASRQQIPSNFLPQIIALLGAKGWVEGVRGPGGGVKLLIDPKRITVQEVVELIEGPVSIAKCLTNDVGCTRQGRCPLHHVWNKAQGSLIEVLNNTSIADVMDIEKSMNASH